MKSVMMLIHIFVFCIIFLSGCGENKAGQEHYALKIETEILSNEQITDKKWQLLATQFYCEQAVQLYADVKEGNTFDMYCYYSDGSTELLCNDIDSEWIRSSWYVDINGGVLAWKENTIVKWGKDGQLIFHYLLDGTIWDVCQLERGDLYLLIDNDEQNKMKIVELDTESGKYNESRCIYVDFQPIQYISGNDKGILLLNKDGIEQYNVKDGSRNEVVLFRRTTYQIDQIENGVSYPSDFRLTEEGKIEILRSRVLEKLSMVDVTEEKTVLVLRTYNVSGIIKKAVDNFNSENEEYYVVIEASEEDEESEDFKQLTNVQLATGNGADIILGSAINDVFALLEKGLLEDLRPYMELSGIEEEDYFPIAFNSWKEAEKIYGVNMYVQPKETWVLKELIKSKEGATIYSFVDALLNYEKEAILWMTWDAQEVLEYLFSGSEDLWGMVDWNNKSCAFENEFFAKMLEVSLRYGDNTKTHTSEVSTLIGPRKNIGLYSYETEQELLEEDKVAIGYLFEDGGHVTINEFEVIGINHESLYKEGAWEFISYLLKEGQYLIGYKDNYYPVSKAAYEALVQREMEIGSIERVYTHEASSVTYKKGGYGEYQKLGEEAYRAKYDITRETADAIYATLEDARALPMKSRPIVEIICEEAAAYFARVKTIEEVIPIIENRVQLYLDERN